MQSLSCSPWPIKACRLPRRHSRARAQDPGGGLGPVRPSSVRRRTRTAKPLSTSGEVPSPVPRSPHNQPNRSVFSRLFYRSIRRDLDARQRSPNVLQCTAGTLTALVPVVPCMKYNKRVSARSCTLSRRSPGQVLARGSIQSVRHSPICTSDRAVKETPSRAPPTLSACAPSSRT
ncbi:hypothetical protein BV22DRAFT_849520 [Leucogyrophana mollusca]|uniref:Uncharacterized protein n=1 Tax=Leucogyrophana mollusca TaxID=85980 RepID=A0ACB8B476_9AGAM|nr:hypothetical protein BV22DRAFT_849520 [Leucogyrophana mollusca]